MQNKRVLCSAKINSCWLWWCMEGFNTREKSTELRNLQKENPINPAHGKCCWVIRSEDQPLPAAGLPAMKGFDNADSRQMQKREAREKSLAGWGPENFDMGERMLKSPWLFESVSFRLCLVICVTFFNVVIYLRMLKHVIINTWKWVLRMG